MLERIFSFEGRIGRLEFLKVFLLAIFLSALVTLFCKSFLDQEDLAIIPALVAQMAILSGASVKRLHDLGRPTLHYFLLFVPIVSIYIMVLLLVRQGTIGPNQYGEDPVGIPEE